MVEKTNKKGSVRLLAKVFARTLQRYEKGEKCIDSKVGNNFENIFDTTKPVRE